MQTHDIPVDLIVTPDEVGETRAIFSRPSGIDWHIIPPANIQAVPILDRLRRGRTLGVLEGGGT